MNVERDHWRRIDSLDYPLIFFLRLNFWRKNRQTLFAFWRVSIIMSDIDSDQLFTLKTQLDTQEKISQLKDEQIQSLKKQNESLKSQVIACIIRKS